MYIVFNNWIQIEKESEKEAIKAARGGAVCNGFYIRLYGSRWKARY